MRLPRSTAALTALLAVALAAGGATAAPAAPPRCATAGLVVWLDTQGNGAAGSFYFKLELTNLSGHACTLFGYPGVSGVDLGGRQIGRAASRNPVHPARRVVLAKGASAVAVLRIVDVGVFPRTACGQTTAAGLRVYPPNQTAPKLVPFPFQACARSAAVYLSVEAVQHA